MATTSQRAAFWSPGMTFLRAMSAVERIPQRRSVIVGSARLLTRDGLVDQCGTACAGRPAPGGPDRPGDPRQGRPVAGAAELAFEPPPADSPCWRARENSM